MLYKMILCAYEDLNFEDKVLKEPSLVAGWQHIVNPYTEIIFRKFDDVG